MDELRYVSRGAVGLRLVGDDCLLVVCNYVVKSVVPLSVFFCLSRVHVCPSLLVASSCLVII